MLNQEFADKGMKEKTDIVIGVLQETPGLTIHQIAKRLEIEFGPVMAVVRKLSQDGKAWRRRSNGYSYWVLCDALNPKPEVIPSSTRRVKKVESITEEDEDKVISYEWLPSGRKGRINYLDSGVRRVVFF